MPYFTGTERPVSIMSTDVVLLAWKQSDDVDVDVNGRNV